MDSWLSYLHYGNPYTGNMVLYQNGPHVFHSICMIVIGIYLTSKVCVENRVIVGNPIVEIRWLYVWPSHLKNGISYTGKMTFYIESGPSCPAYRHCLSLACDVIVQSCYNMVTFLQNTHNRHSIAQPWWVFVKLKADRFPPICSNLLRIAWEGQI